MKIRPFPAFSKNDRILIFAPHPDDESIGCGGVMQHAISKGLPVQVVYYTNGDNNELAFIVYEKHLVRKSEEFVRLGEVRRSEAINAMKKLGLGSENMTFLGYPDFGTMRVLSRHWGDVPPHKSMLTRVTHVPYPECFTPGAPYSGESILNDIIAVLQKFKPTKVFVTLPVDFNPDHRTLPVFLQVALWDLDGALRLPEVFYYVIHVVKWPDPRGYYPYLDMDVPQKLEESDVEWMKYDLIDKQVEKKRDVISSYLSQIEYEPDYLVSFARKNELFGSFPVLTPAVITDGEINWDTEKEVSSFTGHVIKGEHIEHGKVRSVSFVRSKTFIYFRIIFHRVLSEIAGVRVFLLGYCKDIPFAAMPKIRITFGILEKMKVFDKYTELKIDDALCRFEEKNVYVRVPLSVLGNPKYLFACAQTHIKDLPFDKTAWRILQLS